MKFDPSRENSDGEPGMPMLAVARSVFAVAIAAGLFVMFAAEVAAQQKPEFEVASVKAIGRDSIPPMRSKRGGPGTSDPTHVVFESYPLNLLVIEAYDVNFFQVSGLSSARGLYKISANMPPGTTREQYRQMLQRLLADRFQLKVHLDKQEMPIYEMSVAKNGNLPKQHTGAEAVVPVEGAPVSDKDGPIPAPGQWGVQGLASHVMRFRFNLVDLTMQQFAQNVSSNIGRTIVNATEISGKYDFALSCVTDTTRPPEDETAPAPTQANENPAQQMVSQQLAACIQKQLGLRLEPKKAVVEMLVVDHFENTPTEN